jgi:hypothetical protein
LREGRGGRKNGCECGDEKARPERRGDLIRHLYRFRAISLWVSRFWDATRGQTVSGIVLLLDGNGQGI